MSRGYQTDVRLSRQKQIDTLRVFNENVTEIVQGKEYSISFKSSSLNLKLDIKLPENFPIEKPYLEITPAVYHQWVDPSGAVHSPGLRSFTQHSDLGMVVLALRSELEKAHLALWNPEGGTKAPDVSPPSTGATPATLSPPSASSDNISTKLGELSVDELKSILNDEDRFEKFIMDIESEHHPLVTHYLGDGSIATLRDNLETKARANQELQSQIESSRNKIICKYQDFHCKKSDLQGSVKRLRELDARVQPNVLADKLLGLAVDCDEESEEIAESFLQTQLSIDDFLSKYIKSRGDGYLKKIKADKLKKS